MMKIPEQLNPELKKAVEPYLERFFFKRMLTSYQTQKGYRYQICKFFKAIGSTPEEYFKKVDIEATENQLLKIYHDMIKIGAAPYTIKGHFNAVKQFLCTFEKQYRSLDFWETFAIRMKNAEPISEELVPNKLDLKRILEHGNTVTRAMFLIQASCGLRIGELCSIKKEDVKSDETPIRIWVNRSFDPSKPDSTKPFTKTSLSRNCFLTPEAAEAYHAWMKERDEWLRRAVKVSAPYKKLPDDTRVFPMHVENARKKWRNLVKKAGYDKKDEKSGIHLVHPHCLRKFFRSYLGDADLAEHIMGHAQGMTRQYRNMKLEDLQKEFLKYADNITIFGPSTNFSQMNESLEAKDREIKSLQEKVKDLDEKTSMLKFTVQSFLETQKNTNEIKALKKQSKKK